MQPLLEVFGYPVSSQSEDAIRCRQHRLCPFGNRSLNCTKDKANNPLGVCSLTAGEQSAIVCPVRFNERSLVVQHAAEFFFSSSTRWTALREIRLKDINGLSAGNIDFVLVSYDDNGQILDFGAIEVQAVYISGNIRNPFEFFMGNQHLGANFDWDKQPLYPKPDYLSSSRKRLAPQLLYKGGILRSWNAKLVVALDIGFLATLPPVAEVEPACADMLWLGYHLKHDADSDVYKLELVERKYCKFDAALQKLTIALPGKREEFIAQLQRAFNSRSNVIIEPKPSGKHG
jgi:hypothetical protein